MYLLSCTLFRAYLVPEAKVSAVGVVPQYQYHTGEADNLVIAYSSWLCTSAIPVWSLKSVSVLDSPCI